MTRLSWLAPEHSIGRLLAACGTKLEKKKSFLLQLKHPGNTQKEKNNEKHKTKHGPFSVLLKCTLYSGALQQLLYVSFLLLLQQNWEFPCNFPDVNAVTVRLLLASSGSVLPFWPGSALNEACQSVWAHLVSHFSAEVCRLVESGFSQKY